MTYVSTHAASSLFGWKDRKKKDRGIEHFERIKKWEDITICVFTVFIC